ncbi:conserved hypothetical protein [Listeria monocytogenes str. 4b H7858]|nr:conserved hypothetical protein [Listeria monocytogenes str. 4b H7858] [Listeria monocytogenes serotype 4b str. H7858]
MEENTLETSPTSKAMEKFRIDSLPNSTSASTVKITVKMVLIERVNVWRNALLTAFAISSFVLKRCIFILISRIRSAVTIVSLME